MIAHLASLFVCKSKRLTQAMRSVKVHRMQQVPAAAAATPIAAKPSHKAKLYSALTKLSIRSIVFVWNLFNSHYYLSLTSVCSLVAHRTHLISRNTHPPRFVSTPIPLPRTTLVQVRSCKLLKRPARSKPVNFTSDKHQTPV